MRFMFTWSITGSTIIEAASLPEAQKRFDVMSIADVNEDGESDFAQDQVMIESNPGCFDIDVTPS